MINFNSLPIDKPNNLPAKGTYYGTIDSAEMKQGQDVTKPPYLNISILLKNKEGKSCGKIYDIISESTSDIVQYKIARFILALGLENLQQFELVDLPKIIKNKQFIVDVTIQEASNGYAAKAIVDVFTGSIYYPMSEASAKFNTSVANAKTLPNKPNQADKDELFISAEDAADVHPVTENEDF